MKKPEHIVLCIACISLVIVAILTTIQPPCRVDSFGSYPAGALSAISE